MAALTLIQPTRAGVLSTGTAVTVSDTIARNVLGSRGVLLEVVNGNAAPDNMTISDASVTPSDAAAAALAPTVANGTSRIFKILPYMADPITGLVTVTHSVTATVTCKLYPRD